MPTWFNTDLFVNVLGAFALLSVLPFGLALVLRLLTRSRWPGNRRWLALFGAVVMVGLILLVSLAPGVQGNVGSKAYAAAYIAVLAYVPWLLGISAAHWVRVPRPVRRTRSPSERAYNGRLAQKAFEARAAQRVNRG
jgi:predicted Na+-dependent transporter